MALFYNNVGNLLPPTYNYYNLNTVEVARNVVPKYYDDRVWLQSAGTTTSALNDCLSFESGTTDSKVNIALQRYYANGAYNMDYTQENDFWNTIRIQLCIGREHWTYFKSKVMKKALQYYLEQYFTKETIDGIVNSYMLIQKEKNKGITNKKRLNSVGKGFWENIRTEYNIHPNMMIVFQDYILQKVGNKRKKFYRSTKSNIKHIPCDDPIMSEYEKKKNMTEEEANSIPYTTENCMSNETLHLMQSLQAELVQCAQDEIIKSRENKSDSAHVGENLGTTFVRGGRHCHKIYKGSYHPGRFLYEKHLSLRLRLQQAISDALNEAFGNCKWFKNLKKLVRTYDEKYGKNITDALIGDTPCTAFFFNTGTCKKKVRHIDANAHGATFLFCVEHYEGGEINIEVPGSNRIITHHMTPGKILAGRWSRSFHYNTPVAEGVERFSYICYFDENILAEGMTWVPKPGWLLEFEEAHPEEANLINIMKVGRKRKKQTKIGADIVVDVDALLQFGTSCSPQISKMSADYLYEIPGRFEFP